MLLPEKPKVFQKNFIPFLKSTKNVEYFQEKLEPQPVDVSQTLHQYAKTNFYPTFPLVYVR